MYVTMRCEPDVKVDDAVCLTGFGLVGRADGELFGRVEYIRDGECTVQVSGLCEFTNSSVPVYGDRVFADRSGRVHGGADKGPIIIDLRGSKVLVLLGR